MNLKKAVTAMTPKDDIRAFCEGCEKPQAVYLAEIVKGKIKQYYLCESCPLLKDFYVLKPSDAPNVAAISGQPAEEGKEILDLTCPKCGLTYEQFIVRGYLGCSECYSAFREPLKLLLAHIHGSDIHLGKAPKIIRGKKTSAGNARKTNRIDTLLDMKEKLKTAVEKEDFGQAAQLRDKIHDAGSHEGNPPQADQFMGEGI